MDKYRPYILLLIIAAIVLLKVARVGQRASGHGTPTWLFVLMAIVVGAYLLAALLRWLVKRRLAVAFSPERFMEMQQRWEEESAQRREAREHRKQERKVADRRFFGEELRGVSEGHRRASTDETKLKRLGLPVLRSERELADWFGISLPRLRWFTHHKAADTVSHYVRYKVPKRTGGERVILAPKRDLRKLQRKILRGILDRVPVSETAHGFVGERSIVTNASPHVGKAVVANLDLKDFFPSITFPRVRGLFIMLGYSFPLAGALALLCTECEREVFDRGEERFYVGVGPRALVQGAPTSPALANLVAWKLDRRLAALARKWGFTYTRYADDLTFSGDDAGMAPALVALARRIVADEGFEVNPDKTRLFRRSGKQVVTGLVVNDRVNTPRKLRRKVRAILANARKTGLQAQNRDGHPNFRRHLAGLISFIHSANPDHAAQLRQQLDAMPD